MIELSGRCNKSCYRVLCLAVDAARGCLPGELKMCAVCAMVQTRTGMSAEAVSKALSRVAADIWDYGNRDKLTPKELIFVLAVHCQAPESRSRVVTTLLPDPVS